MTVSMTALPPRRNSPINRSALLGAGRDHEDPATLNTRPMHEEDHGPPERRRVHDDVAGIAAHAGHCGEGEEDADDKTHADLFAALCEQIEGRKGEAPCWWAWRSWYSRED